MHVPACPSFTRGTVEAGWQLPRQTCPGSAILSRVSLIDGLQGAVLRSMDRISEGSSPNGSECPRNLKQGASGSYEGCRLWEKEPSDGLPVARASHIVSFQDVSSWRPRRGSYMSGRRQSQYGWRRRIRPGSLGRPAVCCAAAANGSAVERLETSRGGSDLRPDDKAPEEPLWKEIQEEARLQSVAEPYLASFLYATILAHSSLEKALAFHVANKLADATLLSTQLFALFSEIFLQDAEIKAAIRADMQAFKERDPACSGYVHGMLYFKGFLACQIHRASHKLWHQSRISLALALQNRVSEVFQVDIHPGATLGHGLLFDHATGVVIGETAVVGNNVSILHHVTLGGTGAAAGDRHPKIRDGVLIGAGATLLGPIVVGEGAQIGASSLVLSEVPPFSTAVGVPARIIEPKGTKAPEKRDMPGQSMDHCSTIIDDYQI